MKEAELKLFNDLLLEIYYVEDLKKFEEKCLRLIKAFIHYEQAYFVLLDNDGKINLEYSTFKNVEKNKSKEYVEKYYAIDYLNDVCGFSKSMTYRDTDLLSDERRISSEFYRKYFQPQNLDKGCGMIIMDGRFTRCFINLIRKTGDEDVTEHEMRIMELLLPHVEKNILYMMREFKKNRIIPNSNLLSNREKEVVEMVKMGYSNQEIGEKLGISSATVKKHISNIFIKTGKKKRTQL